MRDKLIKLITTFFYVGFFPVGPGTAASFIGFLISILLRKNILLYLGVTLVITILGFMISGQMEVIMKRKDPSCVVIDEVAGVMISFFMLPLTAPIILTTFFLFRAFDMFKIYPVNKFEELSSSTGIMMDDIIAGIYTNIAMHIAIKLTGII
jgi:phosphatidylglycerophosphatase A